VSEAGAGHPVPAVSSVAGEPHVSIVVPVYGCRECLHTLHGRITAALEPLELAYELVLVDDRSRDGSWDVLLELAAADATVRLVRLSRNFGQHAAITAGLATSRGAYVVVMDCDLQDPPEEIPRLLAKAGEGYDIVFAQRKGRQDSWFRRTASMAYFSLLNAILGTKMSSEFGNFSIVSRKVVDAFLDIRDKDRHYLMILEWLGFRTAAIPFQHAERLAGTSTYTLRTLLRFAFDGLFFQTTTLLRWIVYSGFVLSFGGLGLAIFFVANYFFGSPYPGWTSLGVLLLLIGGFIITSTGVTGLYIGKIFTQVKDRPLYVIDVEVERGVKRPDRATGGEST
jgi:glycosyltransferase involved in cell wall biosynthesis